MNKKVQSKYKKHLEQRNKRLTKVETKFLKPCECCGKFLLLDFDICPLCNHQQGVD